FHAAEGLRLTPAYDLVAAALYPEFRTLALAIGGATNLTLNDLKPKHIVSLAKAYGLKAGVLLDALAALDRRRSHAAKAVVKAAAKIGAEQLGRNLLEIMERRWNGTFASVGNFLSKKQS